MHSKLKWVAVGASLLLLSILLAGCGEGSDDEERGVSRSEVEEIVQSAIAQLPDPTPGLSKDDVQGLLLTAVASVPTPRPVPHQSEPTPHVEDTRLQPPEADEALTRADIEDIVSRAIAEVAEREASLSREEVQRIARNVVASIPLRSAPAEYTKFVVENAISKYDAEGLDATLSYYNRLESVDGRWFVFIVDADNRVIAHYNPHLLNEDLRGPLGTDPNSYRFGREVLSATEQGKWVSYVFRNPERGVPGADFGNFELKNVWVVKHGDLLFASGWYIDADLFTQFLVADAVSQYRTRGLQATLDYFATQETVIAGLESTIAYYNDAETIPGEWFAFIADRDGTLVGHNNPEKVGRNLADLYLFKMITQDFTEEGVWVAVEAIDSATGSMESMRSWVVKYDGVTFGSGWYNSEPGD